MDLPGINNGLNIKNKFVFQGVFLSFLLSFLFVSPSAAFILPSLEMELAGGAGMSGAPYLGSSYGVIDPGFSQPIRGYGPYEPTTIIIE